MNKVSKHYLYFQYVPQDRDFTPRKSSSDETKHCFPHSSSSIKTIKQRPTYSEGNFPRNVCMFSFAAGLMASTLWAWMSVMDETSTVSNKDNGSVYSDIKNLKELTKSKLDECEIQELNPQRGALLHVYGWAENCAGVKTKEMYEVFGFKVCLQNKYLWFISVLMWL